MKRHLHFPLLCAGLFAAVVLLMGCPGTPDAQDHGNGGGGGDTGVPGNGDGGNGAGNGGGGGDTGDTGDAGGSGSGDSDQPDVGTDDPENGERDPDDVLDPNTVQPEDEARTEAPEPTSGVINEVSVGDAVPQFSLPRVDALETMVTPQEWQGRWTLIKFWSSWCSACKELAVQLIDPLYRKYASEEDSPLQIVSIGFEAGDSPERQYAFAQEEELGWLKLFDRPRGEPSSAVALFGAVAVPSVVLINPEGVVVTYGSLERPEWSNHLVAYFDYLFDEQSR